ncbi:hypothetical protein ACGFIF_26355 [Kribbella sp. NPDC049174]|uniref:hypothetical protein n=1 Tax=Kribbella sp. NPDC049174 TaxID=3364112 RepID=UPI00370F940A
MPPAPAQPPEPSTLHQAFERNGPLDWGENALTAADIARAHGAKASRKSLQLLERTVALEPRITAQFLASLPPTASPYHLASRVKSPDSLARKIRNASAKRSRIPLDDVLRYTALTASSNELVDAARHTIDRLTDQGWRVTYAVQSYTDGSRYKGVHAYLAVPGIDRVEVQFHSAASAKVKELTTPWYEIERSAHASKDERAARKKCVDLSATLSAPPGIDGLTELGGRTVAVCNYSDSRARPVPPERLSTSAPRATVHTPVTTKNDGMMR